MFFQDKYFKREEKWNSKGVYKIIWKYTYAQLDLCIKTWIIPNFQFWKHTCEMENWNRNFRVILKKDTVCD